jgi:hypothetical protein
MPELCAIREHDSIGPEEINETYASSSDSMEMSPP